MVAPQVVHCSLQFPGENSRQNGIGIDGGRVTKGEVVVYQ